MKKTLMLTVCSLMTAQSAFADSNANGHAPIGVMGDHNHLTGEWMVGYRFTQMSMENPLLGTDEIFASAMMAPSKMTKQMQMLGLMYGVTDKLTMVIGTSHVKATMDHVMKSGMEASTVQAKGMGDSKVTALYTLYQTANSKLLGNVSLNLPTGSIEQRGDTPMEANQLLSYAMQPGSGTFAVTTKLTYTYNTENWAAGAQVSTMLRTGQNNNGYTLGDKTEFTVWAAKNLTHDLSFSLRLDANKWGGVSADFDIYPELAMENLRGGERVDLLAGLNFIMPSGPLKGNRLAVEFGKPLYQDVNGAATESDYRMTVGWQLAF